MNNLIPKIIHYCWFGPNKVPANIKKCINSWNEMLPDYQMKLWNEENFNIEQNIFVKQAYEAGKFAFVADYARLQALYLEGGIYLDTDMQIIKNIDRFLQHSAFSGCENINTISAGIIGVEKEHPWIKRLLEYYTDRSFIKENGSMDMRPITRIISEIMEKEYDWIPGKNELQKLKHDVVIYPKEYFYPKDWQTKETILTSKSYTIHHFDGSWIPKEKYFDKVAYNLKVFFYTILKQERYEKIKKILKQKDLHKM